MVMSPTVVWSSLAAVAERAEGITRRELNRALRLTSKNIAAIRCDLCATSPLKINSSTVILDKINAILLNRDKLPMQSFLQDAKTYYEANAFSLNFNESQESEYLINKVISVLSKGRISDIVTASFFENSYMILASALFFQGQWTMPFLTSRTTKSPFYSSSGQQIGEVNMMYSKHTYPFSNIKKMQAKVIELPYDIDSHLSMFVMLPNPGVTIEDTLLNFNNITLDEIYEELHICGEAFGDDKVDVFIPRFTIDSSYDLTNVLRGRMGLVTLFDKDKSSVPYVALSPMFVSKVVHKVGIEVTEDGVTAYNDFNAAADNNTGTVKFEANRPFVFLIVEKLTNSILLGGIYRQPFLY